MALLVFSVLSPGCEELRETICFLVLSLTNPLTRNILHCFVLFSGGGLAGPGRALIIDDWAGSCH